MESSGGPVERAQPSQTAMTAAAARAAHLIVDHEPVIFADTLAGPLLGDRADELLDYHRLNGSHPVLASARGQVVYRSRYTEDALAAAAQERGVAQYVVLGAGLDSFAYRSPLAGDLATFEVDHPATQEWKRGQLAAAGIRVPDMVAFVPLDFERQGAGSLMDSLVGGGFDPARPALISWLGVTMYLTLDAIEAVLGVIGGGFAPGTELILDYMLPAGLRDAIADSYVEQVAPFAASRGEPWLTFLGPAEVAAMLTKAGFSGVRDVGQSDIGGPELWRRTDALTRIELSRLVHAVV
ncbi:MAG TPA: SAM-dependent methyltransferase [Streptosporangiaceae bacterium]|nr:SAM-dependent methyltransferase [Streptosporangiaceae bacterium]